MRAGQIFRAGPANAGWTPESRQPGHPELTQLVLLLSGALVCSVGDQLTVVEPGSIIAMPPWRQAPVRSVEDTALYAVLSVAPTGRKRDNAQRVVFVGADPAGFSPWKPRHVSPVIKNTQVPGLTKAVQHLLRSGARLHMKSLPSHTLLVGVGGTTQIAIYEDGRVIRTGALGVGHRVGLPPDTSFALSNSEPDSLEQDVPLASVLQLNFINPGSLPSTRETLRPTRWMV